MSNYNIHLQEPHPKQEGFVNSPAKRIVVRAGRRSGKTVGVGIRSVMRFLKGRRQLYAAPTMEQVGRYWATVTRALDEPIRAGKLHKNESEHFIEVVGTETRLKAKTAWNADSLRGDYADDLYLDEWQLMNEDAWELVGAPMLLDNNGDAIFIYTPPSLRSRSASKAKDPQHAAKLYKKAEELQKKGKRWAVFHFTSHDNPNLSVDALDEIATDMTSLGYRMEIMAEDISEAPGALWTRKSIDAFRVFSQPSVLSRIVVAVDPSTSSTGSEAGIVVCGKKNLPHPAFDGYVLADKSLQGSPLTWAREAVKQYYAFSADVIVAEKNQGGEMVEITIHQIDPKVPVKLVHASRGKRPRAEPISAFAEKGQIHHVGYFPALEDELALWDGEGESPNRLDAMVWGMTELRGFNKKRYDR
jgi:hypothetical protein